MEFTQEKVLEYQNIIDNTTSGNYALNVLFDSIWSTIKPTSFGKDFKSNLHRFTGITWNALHKNNSNFYTIT
ncbi:MAG: hypothetical protein ACI86H_002198 [bacterium]|jgi:hypothetical protein